MATHSHIDTPMGAVALLGAAHSIRSNSGLSFLPKLARRADRSMETHMIDTLRESHSVGNLTTRDDCERGSGNTKQGSRLSTGGKDEIRRRNTRP